MIRLNACHSPAGADDDEGGPVEGVAVGGRPEHLQRGLPQCFGGSSEVLGVPVCRQEGLVELDHQHCGAGGFHIPLANDRCRAAGHE